MNIFSLFKQRENIPSRKIFLALRIPAHIDAFSFLGDIIKTDLYKISNRPDNYNSSITDVVVKEILSSGKDILIGDFPISWQTINELNQAFSQNNLAISRIFVPSEERRARELKDTQSLNRWMDFPPGHIEAMHKQNGKALREVRDQLFREGISVSEI